MARIPRSLAPWLLPLLLVAGVIAIAVSFWLGLLVLVALLFGVIPYLRLQYLKQHPPDPELRRRTFWDFR
ncbi:MAG TPA: hypothetical protein VGH93_07125 [Solirubrobacteraceae bacterium]